MPSTSTAAPKVAKPKPPKVPSVHDFGGEPVGPFKNAIIEQEWEGGYPLCRVYTPNDMGILANNGGGCCGDHFFWTSMAKPPSEYFFTLVNPKGNVGTILFCKDAKWWGKKHPQDAEFVKLARAGSFSDIKAAVRVRGYQGEYGYVITSDYYDNRWEPGDNHPWRHVGRDNYYEQRYKEAKAKYEHMKKEAIREHGPLGKDHPLKGRLDAQNQRVTACKGAMEQEIQRTRVTEGMVFEYQGRKLFIVEVAGRGIDYDGANTRYTNKIAEFVEERRVA